MPRIWAQAPAQGAAITTTKQPAWSRPEEFCPAGMLLTISNIFNSY
jgi:hypothetical protein